MVKVCTTAARVSAKAGITTFLLLEALQLQRSFGLLNEFVIPIFVMSLFISSSHLFLGLPSDLVCAGDHSYTFFACHCEYTRCEIYRTSYPCKRHSFLESKRRYNVLMFSNVVPRLRTCGVLFHFSILDFFPYPVNGKCLIPCFHSIVHQK